MNPTAEQFLKPNAEESEILSELLESARTRLLVEIRHTHHRAYRDELRHRLTVIEGLIDRFHADVTA